MHDLKPGDRIELLSMGPDPRPIPAGSQGTVTFVNDTFSDWTQVGVDWDCGRTLMLALPYDKIKKVG